MTSIVDNLDPTHSGGIIGLVPGRSGACVEAWLALQTKEFRDGVTVVAIDPSAPHASGIRRALPQARIVLDHFHLGIKELLRQMLQAHGPNGYSGHQTSTRRTRLLQACVDADMPETTRLAGTIEKWWPEIEGFLELGQPNARTEGYNRVIKQIKRVACGFRNQDNYERRIMLHSAAHRAA